MAIVHRVGDPVDRCERKVIEHLRDNLPDSFHVYHNLELIPRRGGHPYEYDLIVLGKSSVWVIEAKGYRGTIQGNAKTWVLPSGRVERSPIPLTNNKARILKSNIVRYAPRLRDKNSGIYVDALIVLCDPRAEIKLDDPQADRVVHLSEMVSRLVARERKLILSSPGQDESSTICKMLDQWFGPWSFERHIGQYIIEDSIVDRSKHSVTYPARHALLKSRNRVSLKVFQLDASLSEEKLERRKALFVRDAEVLSILGEHSHENVVRCYAPFPWESDKIVLPLEWVDGLTLRDVLDEGINWSFQHRLEIFRQVCEGLAHAHRYGVIHRTLSPENIVVLENNKVKLVNFSLAKIDYITLFTMASAETRHFHATDRRYMAPELRLDHHAATPGSDIFSAGVVLFELMTGQCPFDKRHPIQSETLLKRPTAFAEGLPDDIDHIFLKEMCCFDPDQRCASMEDVLELVGATIFQVSPHDQE